MSTYCYNAPKQSVRFVHKFDPIPSIMAWQANYQHGVAHAILLWDVYDYSCETTTSYNTCSISSASLDSGEDYKSLGLKGTNPDLVKEWVCSKTKAIPVSLATTCDQELTSYQTLLNPFPCGFILAKTYLSQFTVAELASGTIDERDTQGDITECIQDSNCAFGGKLLTGDVEDTTIFVSGVQYDYLTFIDKFFKVLEDFDTCLSDWVVSIYTHFGVAVGAMPDLMGMIFTFSWIHSTYPMYPLCIEIDSSGDIENYIPASIETAVVAEVEGKSAKSTCSATVELECYDFCSFSGYKYELDCYDSCLTNCKPVAVKEVNEKYSISTSDLVTYAGSDYADTMVDSKYDLLEFEEAGEGEGETWYF
jgi:hypothetical protein